MYTGIIKYRGRVRAIRDGGIAIQSELFAGKSIADILGNSFSISGVCLSIVELQDDVASFNVSSETKRKTTLGRLAEGSEVNLEASLCVGDELGGHFVLGHVDQTGSVLSIEEEAGNTCKICFSLPKDIAHFVAPKGSITIDGVSLTVGEVTEDSFSTYIIPITLRETTLHSLHTGSVVNLEVDCLARYVGRLQSMGFGPQA